MNEYSETATATTYLLPNLARLSFPRDHLDDRQAGVSQAPWTRPFPETEHPETITQRQVQHNDTGRVNKVRSHKERTSNKPAHTCAYFRGDASLSLSPSLSPRAEHRPSSKERQRKDERKTGDERNSKLDSTQHQRESPRARDQGREPRTSTIRSLTISEFFVTGPSERSFRSAPGTGFPALVSAALLRVGVEGDSEGARGEDAPGGRILVASPLPALDLGALFLPIDERVSPSSLSPKDEASSARGSSSQRCSPRLHVRI